MSQIRAFLAIDLDDDLKPKINKIIREFKQIDANIKYVDLQNLHFTLKFFGDIDTEGIDLISEKIENVIKDFDSFTIKIKGCGAFPNKNHIKVIWVGLDEDEILKDLHDKLDKEFNSIGFDLDRKFSSHLTIGRMKSAKGKDKVKNTIETYNNIDIGT
ncbi:MAG: RNA 2',3'-cyclic phosphodiesterase, partial [Methanobrevibacter sp.]|nr:RNA 2',3'-cyclic phosphodiesterase [Methanobrevibacter sp.]